MGSLTKVTQSSSNFELYKAVQQAQQLKAKPFIANTGMKLS
jgi:hypothetical protein